jgi:hypothetical protein
MNAQALHIVSNRWGKEIKDLCDATDKDFLGARGPEPLVSTYTLLIGMVYLALESKPVHIKYLHRELYQSTKLERSYLNLAAKPSYRQLCYRLDLLKKALGSGDDLQESIQKLLDLLVGASAGEVKGNTIWAVDGSLYEAWTSQRRTESADPDASWRAMGTSKHKNKPVLGYNLVGLVRAEGTEVCDRIVVTSADVDDGKPAAEMVKRMLAQGIPVERILGDKGYANKPQSYLEPLRKAGVFVTYDVMDKDHKISYTLFGNKIIDGWAYSPALPEYLEEIKRPAPNAGKEDFVEFNTLIARRETYAFRTQGKPTSSKARVASPAYRGKLRCRVLNNSAHDAAPICKVKHRSDEACGIKTMTLESALDPRNYQYPRWGTPEWTTLYAMRSAVERFFGHLQSAAFSGFDHGRFCVRGLEKVSLFTSLFVIATNLHLLESASQKISAAFAKAAAKAAGAPRLYNSIVSKGPVKRGVKRTINTLLRT